MTTPAGSEGDYEYDEAHDAPRDAAAGPAPDRAEEPVSVVTATADTAGDYSYDLAHDVPRDS